MQATLLKEDQKVSYARTAAIPGLNSRGGPDRCHLAEIAVLPKQDRDAVLKAFANDVRSNLSSCERRAISAALMDHKFLLVTD